MSVPIPTRVPRLISRFDGKCHYCHRPVNIFGECGDRPTREHLTPVCRGGSNLLSNIALACETCNSIKGDMTEAEYHYFIQTGSLSESYVEWITRRIVLLAARRGIFVGRE